MKRKFFENLIFFLVLNLLIKPIYIFGIDRIVQNTVGAEVYGSYFPLLNVVLILQIFLDLGIDNFIRREVAQNQKKVTELLSGLLVVKFVLILLFVVVLSSVGIPLLKTPEEKRLLFLLLINQSLASLILFIRSNLGGLHYFKLEGIISVLDRTFMILFCGALLINPVTKANFKIEWFVLTQTLAYTTSLIVSIIISSKKVGAVKLNFRIVRFMPVLRKLIPYTFLVLTMAIYYRIDSIFLRFFIPNGQEQAGIYAQSFRILDFISNYAFIFALILLPVFSNLISLGKRVDDLLKSATLFLIIPVVSIISAVIFYRDEVFNLLYKEHVTISADTFAILSVSFIGVAISYTFGALLTANENLKELILMGLIAMTLSVVLNILLIPRFQVLGAAISNGSSQFFTVIFHIVVAKKRLNIPVNKILVLKNIAFVIFITVNGLFFRFLNIPWLVSITMIIAINIAFAFVIRLFKPSIIYQLLEFKTGQN